MSSRVGGEERFYRKNRRRGDRARESSFRIFGGDGKSEVR
jgi:hypothetical protein